VSFAVYCAVAYWQGYTKFKKLQVLDGASADELRLPAGIERLLVQRLQSISGRFTGQFSTLIKKELRLQQVSLLLAVLFCAAAVAGALLYKLRPDWGSPVLVATYPIYLILLPFIVGALSVAEERAWGVAEWHLTLPPSVRKQWSAKLLSALLITLVLGWLLPIGVFVATEGLFGNPGVENGQLLADWAPVCLLCQLFFTIVAIYTGSFSNSTLRAALMAVGMVMAMLLCTQFGPTQIMNSGPARGFPESDFLLPATVGVFILLGVTQRFVLRNHRHQATRYRTLFFQVLVLLFLAWLFECITAVFWHVAAVGLV